MKSLRFLDRRIGSSLAAVGLLLGLVVPAAVPAFASADVLTDRSIALSSSKADDSGVNYDVKFTTVGAAGAVILDFCSDSPIPGQTCAAPGGFTLASATVASSTPSATKVAVDANTVELDGTFGAAASVDIKLATIHNPTAVGTFYARIVSYDTTTNAATYTSTNLHSGVVDEGGVALSTTTSIGISASVRESLTFCVANVTIGDGCTGTSGHDPDLTLGEDDGSGALALSSSAVSHGDIFAQLSTNAATGAVVSMKSNATGCGGLVRQGALTDNCNILPANSSDISEGDALFGVKVAADTDGTDAFGTVTASGDYGPAAYHLGYASDNSVGVTSAYGDPIFSSDGPAANKNEKLTFGASVAPQTPAGTYKASLNLVATGTY